MADGETPQLTQPPEDALGRAGRWVRRIGLALGPIAAVLVYTSIAPGDGLTEPGRRVLALAAWMAAWWLTEAIPLSVTALLPLAVLPVMNVGTMKQVAAPYASEVIFLFFGGFVLGEALQSTGLHRRIALNTLLAVGTTPSRIVGGVMLATAMMSMWVSNTATTIMMIPIGVSVVALVEKAAATGEGRAAGWNERSVRNLGVSVVLAIAYAASIGGLGTPIGSPPNLIMRNFASDRLGRNIDFVDWSLIALPIVAVFLPLTWLFLTRVMFPVRARAIRGGREMLLNERRGLGRMSTPEWITFGVFMCTAVSWVMRSWICRWLGLTIDVPGKPDPLELLSDAGIAVAAAILLLTIPTSLREWKTVVTVRQTSRLPWDILLLFGGGLSIAWAMEHTQVDVYLGGLFEGLGGMSFIVILAVLATAIVFGGELASNSAVVTAMMPVLIAAAPTMGVEPLPLMMGVTLAASCGFMLPVATPPNAIAYASGRVTQGQMIRAGFWLDWAGIALIVAAMALYGAAMLRSG